MPAVGGVEKHLANVLETLNDQSYEFVVLTASHKRGLPLVEKAPHAEIIRIPHGKERNPLAVCRYIQSIRHRIAPYHVLHIHDVMPLLFWWIPVLSLGISRPYMTFHGYEQDPVPIFWRLVRHVSAKIAKESLCIGRFIEDIYGIECDHLSIGAVRSIERESHESSGLIYVGRLEPDTGIMSYIEALKILRRQYNLEIPLTVCGAGSLADAIRRLARQEDLDVTLKGVVNNPAENINGRLASLSAGYLSILESMMMGVPVIGMAKTYLRHRYLLAVRKAGGPISIQTNASGIADEIVRLYQNKNLRKTLSRRAERFAEKHSWEKLADIYRTMWAS